MIDEELYQRATDELNSDKRRPHLWARACALASDDHDEARYLYTNLRVEELLNERDNAPAAGGTDTSEIEVDQLELEPVQTPASDPLDGLDLEKSASDASDAESTRPGTTHSIRNALNMSHGLDQESSSGTAPDEDSLSSERTRTVLDLDGDSTLDLDPSEIARANAAAADPTPLASGSASPSPSDVIRDQLMANLEAGVSTSPGGRPSLDDSSALSSDDLAWLDNDPSVVEEPEPAVVRDPLPDEDDHVFPTLAVPAVARRWDDDDDHATSSSDQPPAFGSGLRDDYADSRDLDALLRDDEADLDDDEQHIAAPSGRGGLWAVYETSSGTLKPVHRGVSWGALFLTLPWLLLRGLYGTAILYTLLWVVALGGLLMTGLAWMDAGQGAPDMLKLACIGFGAVAVVGLLIVPFLRANRWREKRFIRRGYRKLAKVRARSAGEAVGHFRQELA